MPTADPLNLYGRIITRRDVALAYVSFLQAWVPAYIAEIERQAGLAPRTIPLPPDPNLSYRQGLDWNTWEQKWSPCYIVNPQAYGQPERQYSEGQYLQTFRVQVCCNVVVTNQMLSLTAAGTPTSLAGLEEDSASQYADMYAGAAMAAILQHGGIGAWPDGTPVAAKTVLEQYPQTTFPEEGSKRIARSVFIVNSVVDSVVQESDGPSEPPADPYSPAGDWPVVSSTNADIVTVPDSGTVPSTII